MRVKLNRGPLHGRIYEVQDGKFAVRILQPDTGYIYNVLDLAVACNSGVLLYEACWVNHPSGNTVLSMTINGEVNFVYRK